MSRPPLPPGEQLEIVSVHHPSTVTVIGYSAKAMHAYANAVSAADNAALRERVKVLEELVRDLKAYAYNGNYPNSSTPHFNAVIARVRAALEAKP